jgi:transcription antitermination factor NusG
MISWYAATLRSGCEIAAEAKWSDLGVEAFVPKYRSRFLYHGKPREVIRPLWPSYVFVRTVMSGEAWHMLADGVEGFLGFLNGASSHEFWPEPVPDARVGEARRMCDADGIWVEPVEPEPVRIVFEYGQNIEITHGPFAGRRGVVCFARRAWVWANFEALQADLVTLKLPAEICVHSSDPAAPGPEYGHVGSSVRKTRRGGRRGAGLTRVSSNHEVPSPSGAVNEY